MPFHAHVGDAATTMVKRFFHLALVVGAGLASVGGAQDAAPPAASPASPWRVFLDCPRCDDADIRQRLGFVALVRDPGLADTHVIVASAPTGAGGERFLIEAIRRAGARRDTLSIAVGPAATPLEVRDALARGIRLALVPALLQHPLLARLDVVVRDDTAAAVPSARRDPWHRWVFRVGASGDVSADDNYGQRQLQGEFSAARVTVRSRLLVTASGAQQTSRVRLADSSTLRAVQRDRSLRWTAVTGIGEHIAFGTTGSAESSVFQNTRLRARLRAALEGSLFPYREGTRRQALLRYAVGADAMRYVDTTIFGRLRETRPVHEATLRLDLREPWGGAWLRGGISQYLHDRARRRATVELFVDWRIRTGVTVFASGSYAVINDQIGLVGGALTDADRLLRLRELRSGLASQTALGVAFTFGSVFNDVVNLRFPQ